VCMARLSRLSGSLCLFCPVPGRFQHEGGTDVLQFFSVQFTAGFNTKEGHSVC
jgi:hypothetical protein